MTDKEYKDLLEFQWVGGLIPINENAIEFCETLKKGDIVELKDVTKRDLVFHRAYFGLMSYIYNYLPDKFKKTIPIDKFYQFIKHLRGDYDVFFEFKDGTKLVEYQSISFGKLSQKAFENYVRESLPWIYENVIGVFFEGKVYDNIIETIEQEWEKFLAKL